MSRADQLRRMSADPCGFFVRDGGPVVAFDEAAGIIRDLESTLAARDQRIAELETKLDRLRAENATLTRSLEDGMVAALQDSEDERRRIAAAYAERDAARAELPPWGKPLIQGLVDAHFRGGGLEELAIEELLDGLETEQLRACGIET